MKNKAQGAIRMPFSQGKYSIKGTPINLTWVKIKNVIKKIL
jgi:hypothetical protein